MERKTYRLQPKQAPRDRLIVEQEASEEEGEEHDEHTEKVRHSLVAHADSDEEQIIAAAKLNKTRKSMNLKNSGAVGTRPVMGYTMQPMIAGGNMRRGTMSKTTFAR